MSLFVREAVSDEENSSNPVTVSCGFFLKAQREGIPVSVHHVTGTGNTARESAVRQETGMKDSGLQE